MAYLLAQMWTLLFLAGGIGLVIGLAGGLVSGRRRAAVLGLDLDRARQEADAQRQQAARLSAQVEGLGADLRRLKAEADMSPQVARLEAALREARDAAEHEAAQAAGLRARLGALESAVPPPPADSAAALAAAQAETAGVREELEGLRARIAELEPAAAELASLRRETHTWEAERDELTAAARRLAAIEAGDRAAYAAEAPARAPHWLAARNQWLEHKLGELSGDRPVEPSALEAEAMALRARVAELESVGFTHAPDGEAASESTAEIERLRWRNQYLTSRVRYLEGRADEPQDAPQILETERLRARVAELEAAAASDLSDDVARLRARVAELEAGGGVVKDGPDQNNLLNWRNRYLTSRVDYLERRLSDFESAQADAAPADQSEVAALRAQLAGLQAQADEASRLRARVAEMDATGGGDGADRGDSTLQWRNRYLNSRVKYLEDQVAALRSAAEQTDGSSSEHA